jgi:hypothetical protein
MAVPPELPQYQLILFPLAPGVAAKVKLLKGQAVMLVTDAGEAGIAFTVTAGVACSALQVLLQLDLARK